MDLSLLSITPSAVLPIGALERFEWASLNELANWAAVDLAPLVSVLAQADPAPGGGEGGFSPFSMLLPFMAMFAVMYFLFIMPQKNKDKRFQELIASIKENDRVVTTGGLHGVVTGINREAGRLTLRLDESTGAKVRVALWAIDSVERDD